MKKLDLPYTQKCWRSKIIFRSKVLGHLHYCVYGGYTLRFEIEARLITREVLPETYFLMVIMAAGAQARPFLQFQASCWYGTL
jgi:hypothetical protein